jgi:hypothetical protein
MEATGAEGITGWRSCEVSMGVTPCFNGIGDPSEERFVFESCDEIPVNDTLDAVVVLKSPFIGRESMSDVSMILINAGADFVAF